MSGPTEKDFEALVESHEGAAKVMQRLHPNVPSGTDLIKLLEPMVFKHKRKGNLAIKSITNAVWDVVTARHSLLFGVKRLKVNFSEPVTFHKLFEKGQMWTSDTPVEIYSQFIEFAPVVTGHVLVGGLGLGMCVEMMLKLPGVKSVTVVERSQPLIDFILPQLPSWHKNSNKLRAIQDDIFRFTALAPLSHYDSAFFDTWTSTGESIWADSLVPLYRSVRRRGLNRVSGWGEHEMHGQLAQGLWRAARTGVSAYWKPYRVFCCGLKKVTGETGPSTISPKLLTDLIVQFLSSVGTPEWEAIYQWDEQNVPQH